MSSDAPQKFKGFSHLRAFNMKRSQEFLPLVFAEDYYIHKNGYVFYKKSIIRILPFIQDNQIFLTINNQKYNLLNLMIEYFIFDKSVNYTHTTDKMHPLCIPLRLIKIEKEIILKSKSKLNIRVSSANSRSFEKINISDVEFIIQRDKNKCAYCGCDLRKKSWHIDHIHPLSKNGKNVIENLTLSCKTCNLMKNSMIKKDFIEKCNSIVKYNSI